MTIKGEGKSREKGAVKNVFSFINRVNCSAVGASDKYAMIVLFTSVISE